MHLRNLKTIWLESNLWTPCEFILVCTHQRSGVDQCATKPIRQRDGRWRINCRICPDFVRGSPDRAPPQPDFAFALQPVDRSDKHPKDPDHVRHLRRNPSFDPLQGAFGDTRLLSHLRLGKPHIQPTTRNPRTDLRENDVICRKLFPRLSIVGA